jgi:hypothetical protein
VLRLGTILYQKHLVRTKLALEMEYSISWFGPLFI